MKTKFVTLLLIMGLFSACSKYLDIVPDNLATIDNAFTMRNVAERYLYTCYSWLPSHASITSNPAFVAGHELWPTSVSTISSFTLARGNQGPGNPVLNYWDGSNGGKAMYRGIRDCNIFLENIYQVPDMEEEEKARWTAEVKFIKAYLHYWLFKMYGPIPIMDQAISIDGTMDDVRVRRNTVDEVVEYIVTLLDEALPALPALIEAESTELGRITQPIALSVKAEVLVTAASPLYNGNSDYETFVDQDGTRFFPAYDATKWERATLACKEAIDAATSVGFRLYEYEQQLGQTAISDSTRIQMSIRNSVASRWNREVIWGNSNSIMDQAVLTPRTWDPSRSHAAVSGRYAPPLKMAELFYSDNGVPIEEDLEYDYSNRFGLRTATADERFNIRNNYTTIGLHFNRENRFYATLGFDGGVWYGQGRLDDNNAFYIANRAGAFTSKTLPDNHSVTGYWPKKLISFENTIEVSTYSQRTYPWPVIRLADLYLLYAEALNESEGPSSLEVIEYIDRVRQRAGLKGVVESWTNYSRNPTKFSSQQGLREIIQRERMIELALEGKQYWDLLRWKRGVSELSKPIVGWSIDDSTPEAYYRQTLIVTPRFRVRDYFIPIAEQTLLRNDRLVQNYGW